MHKVIILAAGLLAIQLNPQAARAEAGDGNSLLQVCGPDSSMYALCLGQVSAYVRAFTFAQVAGMEEVYCMPRNATVGQAIDVLVKYLKENPSKRHAGGEVIFLASMSEAWPCAGGPATLHNDGGITLPTSSGLEVTPIPKK